MEVLLLVEQGPLLEAVDSGKGCVCMRRRATDAG